MSFGSQSKSTGVSSSNFSELMQDKNSLTGIDDEVRKVLTLYTVLAEIIGQITQTFSKIRD
jgi:hypothetical protein